nr:hypothetical protein [Tanacetum cinerariifolium]
MTSACNSSKIDSQDVKSKVVCAKCKKCLNSVNHDVCLNNCVNSIKSRGRKQKANISKNETQKEYRPKVSKSKNVGPRESLATPKPRKPRFLLRWSPTGKMFDSTGKLVAPSGDNACTSNTMEPKIKRFPNSTSLLGRSRGRKHKANVSKNEMQQKNPPEIKKPKKVGFFKRLATPKPRKSRLLLRWSPTGRLFDQDGKLVASSKFESQVDCSNGDNACTSNVMEPKIKRFPNSTSLLGRLSRFVCGASTQVVPST